MQLQCQLNQQQKSMLLAPTARPQRINLKILKKGIDVKIQAILRYLEQEEQAKPSLPTDNATCKNSDDITIKEQRNESCKDSDHITIKEERQSTTLNNKQSFTTDIGFQLFALPKDLSSQMQFKRYSMNDQVGKIPVSTYLTRQSQQINLRQIPIDAEKTPPKGQSEQTVIKLQDSAKSEQSDSKRQQIQMNASLKIFGAPLTNSLNSVNLVPPNLQINLSNSLKGKTESHINTARSKKSKKNKENEDEGTPVISLSKEKRVGSRKTPHKTPHSHHYSTAKRLYQYFSGYQRDSKPLTQLAINKMKNEIEQLYKQTRKQGQENNVRTKLLKRIENCKIKN